MRPMWETVQPRRPRRRLLLYNSRYDVVIVPKGAYVPIHSTFVVLCGQNTVRMWRDYDSESESESDSESEMEHQLGTWSARIRTTDVQIRNPRRVHRLGHSTTTTAP